MPEIVDEIQKAAVRRLNQMARKVMQDTERQIAGAITHIGSFPQQTDEVLERFVNNLNANFDELMEREITKDEAIFNFETLSLVQEEELDVIVALEGMVNASRNEHLQVYIGFNTRLGSLFPGKRIDESANPLDPEQLATAFQEALRPLGLDAKNSLIVYRIFNTEVLKKLDVVLNEANSILVKSNVIPDMSVEAARKSSPPARTGPRPSEENAFGSVEEESFDAQDEQPELFSVMQNLLHSESSPPPPDEPGEDSADDASGDQKPVTSAEEYMLPTSMVPSDDPSPGTPDQAGVPIPAMQPFQPEEGQTVEMVDQAKLMEILSNIQEKLSSAGPAEAHTTMAEVEKLDISESLGEILQESQTEAGVVSALDRQSSDIINLVTLLYEAIWQDPSVPIPIKELIGRTQITIIKVALADVEFFNNENHPARAILNEFAAAGIGWTEVESLGDDLLYQKIRELVERILTDYQHDNQFFEELIQDFREFRAQEVTVTQQLEQRILKASERKERLEDIHQLVSEKIEERILGRELHPFIEELLKGPFNKFMVMLVLKEGPGGNAWKQAINTIDVLLWTVQPHEQEGDRDRLELVNPRLLNNLRKALRIATIDNDEADQLIEQLLRVQNETFPEEELIKDTALAQESQAPGDESVVTPAQEQMEESAVFLAADKEEAEPLITLPEVEQTSVEPSDTTKDTEEPQPEKAAAPKAAVTPKEVELTDNDPSVIQVENLSVGMWVEFAGEDENNTRCKLAAKINAIDKYIFVNRQGVKVVEKTRMGLAREIHDGTVSIISDGLLFSRALESVIGNLRESQHEQQTGSAYQPSDP